MNVTAQKPRVTVLTQWYEPEPAYRGQEFASGLVAMGYDVDVVTGFPNYPGGKVYDGYRIRPVHVEFIDNIRITRLPLYPSHDSSKVGRILNYATFMLSAFLYLLLRRRRVQAVYVYHPPITVGFAATLAKFFRRYAIILEIQDLWPDTLGATGMIQNQYILKAVSRACDWVYALSEHIVTQSNGFTKRLIERGVDAKKVSTILGWAQQDVLLASASNKISGFRKDDELRIVFAGNMGKAQALDVVLQAAARLAVSCPGATFYLIGDGAERSYLSSKAACENLQNVIFLSRVQLNKIGAYLSRADILLVNLRDDPLFEITIPSKTQAYLSFGKPIIVAVKGEAAELISAAGAGIAVEPENPRALEAAVLEFSKMNTRQREEMGQLGRHYYDTHLSRDIGLNKFDTVIKAAIQKMKKI
jgi:colanic acid biosynthesis glycosyl transferase WcaI